MEQETKERPWLQALVKDLSSAMLTNLSASDDEIIQNDQERFERDSHFQPLQLDEKEEGTATKVKPSPFCPSGRCGVRHKSLISRVRHKSLLFGYSSKEMTAGTCEPGQRADLTNCTPATRTASTKKPGKQNPARNHQSIRGLESVIPEHGTAEAKKEEERGTQKVAALLPKYKEWRRSLTDGEEQALDHYGGTGHLALNAKLRRGGKFKPVVGDLDGIEDFDGYAPRLNINKVLMLLDQVVNKSRIPEDITVYRGISGLPKKLGVLRPGSIITDKGFVSTSLSSTVALGYHLVEGRAFLVRIKLQKNQRGALTSTRADDRDQEILLPRNSKFKVLSISKSGKMSIVDLEMLS